MDDDPAALPATWRACARCSSTCRRPTRGGRRRTPTARAEPTAAEVPEYYAQDFHFQTGGYLTEDSARLYDVQVETLFMGSAGPMRRAALAPIAHFMAGHDQRQVTLLDVACGTGRFLRQARLAYPAMQLKGLDLSRPYLDEARRQLKGLRGAELIEAAGREHAAAPESVDIVTSIFLFHELPPEVRRAVAAEMARVLKPGGLLVFLDSLQMGDRPGWDGLIEAFPRALPRALLPPLRHRRPGRPLHRRRPGAGADHDAVPVQADGAGEGVRRHHPSTRTRAWI